MESILSEQLLNLGIKIHLLTCYFMTGLIWVVQLVHYPSFRWVDQTKFIEFCLFHQKRITPIVLPVMLLELASAVIIAFSPSYSTILVTTNLVCLALIWGGTFFLSVPAHNVLSKAYDQRAVETLIKTNWLRTVLWSVRSLGLFVLD